MKPPVVSVVVPVHTPTRPIYRAVQSILREEQTQNFPKVQVLIVCHEVSCETIGNQLNEFRKNPSVTLVEFKDGVKSPAGPINHGIRKATGEWILVMGSDDFLEPGFLSSYVRTIQNHSDFDVILLPIKLQNSYSYNPSPIPQLGIRRVLRPVRDRLFYRTAPTALVKRALLFRENAELYTEGITNGEDLIHSTWLWTHSKKIYMNRKLPHYIIGDDATDRVTSMTYPLEDLRKPLELLTRKAWFNSLSPRVLNSFGIKYLRGNILSQHWASLDPDSKKNLAIELEILDKNCKLDRSELSIAENLKLQEIFRGENSIRSAPGWESISFLSRLAKIMPQSLARVFSPNSWTTISTDIVLGNLLWFLNEHRSSKIREGRRANKD